MVRSSTKKPSFVTKSARRRVVDCGRFGGPPCSAVAAPLCIPSIAADTYMRTQGNAMAAGRRLSHFLESTWFGRVGTRACLALACLALAAGLTTTVAGATGTTPAPSATPTRTSTAIHPLAATSTQTATTTPAVPQTASATPTVGDAIRRPPTATQTATSIPTSIVTATATHRTTTTPTAVGTTLATPTVTLTPRATFTRGATATVPIVGTATVTVTPTATIAVTATSTPTTTPTLVGPPAPPPPSAVAAPLQPYDGIQRIGVSGDRESFILNVPYRSQYDNSPYQNANCGPTALGMVLEAYGLNVSNDRLRAIADGLQGTYGYDDGVALDYLVAIAQQAGLRADGLTNPDGRYRHWSMADVINEIRQGYPVVTLVHYASLPDHATSASSSDHFVVVVGVTTQGFVINDPAFSGNDGFHREVRPEQMPKAWGDAIIVHQAAAFLPTHPR